MTLRPRRISSCPNSRSASTAHSLTPPSTAHSLTPPSPTHSLTSTSPAPSLTSPSPAPSRPGASLRVPCLRTPRSAWMTPGGPGSSGPVLARGCFRATSLAGGLRAALPLPSGRVLSGGCFAAWLAFLALSTAGCHREQVPTCPSWSGGGVASEWEGCLSRREFKGGCASWVCCRSQGGLSASLPVEGRV